MLKKAFVILIALCALSSLAGVLMAGLNIYTRSTTPHEETTTSESTSSAPSADVTQTQQ